VCYRLDATALRELITIGLPFNVWGSLYTSFWAASESALVLSLSGVSALGLFSVATVIGSAVNTVTMAVGQVLSPRIVTAFARDGSVRNLNAWMLPVTAGLTLFMILLACAGSFLLDLFVPHFIPKYVAGIAAMKICLWFPVVQAALLPINVLFATGRQWLYGRNVIVGLIVFPIATFLLLPAMGGLLAVITGSLLGRTARAVVVYLDLVALTRRET
jgi:hypothetical protein